MNILPKIELSETEAAILAEIYTNPVVKKHLQIMALEETKELLQYSAMSHNDSDIARALATVQGKLSVLETLLSITIPTKEQ